jgi:hypothetical protein
MGALGDNVIRVLDTHPTTWAGVVTVGALMPVFAAELPEALGGTRRR